MFPLRLAAGVLVAFALVQSGEPADAKGTFSTFDPPGSTYTYVSSVNASGVVSGFYEDSNSVADSFVRGADGTITGFDPPGTSESEAWAIDDDGSVVGWFLESGYQSCFVRSPDGTFTTFDPSDGAALFDYADAVNSRESLPGITSFKTIVTRITPMCGTLRAM